MSDVRYNTERYSILFTFHPNLIWTFNQYVLVKICLDACKN